MKKKYLTTSAVGTKRVGKVLARSLDHGAVIALEGNLGTGKTVFTKGIADGLGIDHVIQSPTFVLMKVYPVRKGPVTNLVHVDCYRIASSRDLKNIGLEDYLNDPSAIVVIEWADRIQDMLPKAHIAVTLQSKTGTKREITVHGFGAVSNSGKQGKVPNSP